MVMGAERIEENGVGNLLNFSETSRLFDYGFGSFSYRTILKDTEIIQEVPGLSFQNGLRHRPPGGGCRGLISQGP